MPIPNIFSYRQIFQNIWLLPGNDNKIHAYRGCYDDRSFVEIPVAEFFVEFDDIPGIVLCLKILYYNNYHKYEF